jgi:hypothetical protein
MVGCLKTVGGLSLILTGLGLALMTWGFGGMIDPALTGSEWWLQYLRNTWQGFLFSFALLFVGACLLSGSPNRRRWNRWTPIAEPVHFLVIDRQKSI